MNAFFARLKKITRKEKLVMLQKASTCQHLSCTSGDFYSERHEMLKLTPIAHAAVLFVRFVDTTANFLLANCASHSVALGVNFAVTTKSNSRIATALVFNGCCDRTS